MRGRQLLLEKLLPRAPSRRAAGNKLVFSFQLVRPCELGAFSCFGVMVTAADRVAATCQRRGTKVFLYSIVCMRKPPMAKGHRRLSICRSPPPHVRGGSVSRSGLTHPHRRAPTSQAEPPQKKHTPQTPSALRERGVWGERRFSQRSGLSPQPFPFPHTASSGGGPGEGLLAEKPLPRSLSKNEYCSR